MNCSSHKLHIHVIYEYLLSPIPIPDGSAIMLSGQYPLLLSLKNLNAISYQWINCPS